MKTTLTLTKRQKNGGARYAVQGMRASAYFPPSMFIGEPPASIDIDEPGQPATGPDNQPLTDGAGQPVEKGTIFATEMKARAGGGTTSGTRVNAELAAARQKAKELREQSKQVLKDARAKTKKAPKAANQPSLTEEAPANV